MTSPSWCLRCRMAPSAHSPSTNSKRIGSPSAALRRPGRNCGSQARFRGGPAGEPFTFREAATLLVAAADERSGEHTAELQSRPHLVCPLLLDTKTRHYY